MGAVVMFASLRAAPCRTGHVTRRICLSCGVDRFSCAAARSYTLVPVAGGPLTGCDAVYVLIRSSRFGWRFRGCFGAVSDVAPVVGACVDTMPPIMLYHQ